MQDFLLQDEKGHPGDHLVALYRNENEIENCIIKYIHAALLRNERCIYIKSDADHFVLPEKVKKQRENTDSPGDLIFIEKSNLYSESGKFCPDTFISLLKVMAENAIQDGFTAIAVTCDISWIMGYEDGEDMVIEYEGKLGELISQTYSVSALCRYNITDFSDEMIRNVIQMHPYIIWQNTIHENPYYVHNENIECSIGIKQQVEALLEDIHGLLDTKSSHNINEEKSQKELCQLNENMTNGTIKAFLKLLETHDLYTKGHCSNVASLALKLAERLHVSDEYNTKIFYAALVHDIGKTIIPIDILNKKGKLTAEEYECIKMHSEYGASALSQMDQLDDIALAVRHHHEHYDGKGYPDGLSGSGIPLISRIISICDSYDAITNDRPYRKAQSHEYALKELDACSGKQFDGFLVNCFKMMFTVQAS
jgi:putative nucleotidyltransferase with HDIG domain